MKIRSCSKTRRSVTFYLFSSLCGCFHLHHLLYFFIFIIVVRFSIITKIFIFFVFLARWLFGRRAIRFVLFVSLVRWKMTRKQQRWVILKCEREWQTLNLFAVKRAHIYAERAGVCSPFHRTLFDRNTFTSFSFLWEASNSSIKCFAKMFSSFSHVFLLSL